MDMDMAVPAPSGARRLAAAGRTASADWACTARLDVLLAASRRDRDPRVHQRYAWAFMLMSILADTVGLGFWVMKRQSQVGHVRPLAMMEAMVAIAPGVLLWIGFWVFIDVHLVPCQWWALCMVIAGALGSILTRSLYDEQQARAAVRAQARSTQRTAAAHASCGLLTTAVR